MNREHKCDAYMHMMKYLAVKMKEGMNNVEETGEHYAQGVKPDRKRQVLHDLTVFANQKLNSQDQREWLLPGAVS